MRDGHHGAHGGPTAWLIERMDREVQVVSTDGIDGAGQDGGVDVGHADSGPVPRQHAHGIAPPEPTRGASLHRSSPEPTHRAHRSEGHQGLSGPVGEVQEDPVGADIGHDSGHLGPRGHREPHHILLTRQSGHEQHPGALGTRALRHLCRSLQPRVGLQAGLEVGEEVVPAHAETLRRAPVLTGLIVSNTLKSMQIVSNSHKEGLGRVGIRGILALATCGMLARMLLRVLDEIRAGWRAGGQVDGTDLLVAVLAGAAVLLLTWLALGVALELLTLLPGSTGALAARLAALLTPRSGRQLAALVLGVGAVASCGSSVPENPAPHPALTATAQHESGLPAPAWAPASDLPEPGWVPSVPRVRPQVDPTPLTGPARSAPTAHEHVVRRGESLWTIAAGHLHPGASTADIDAEWRRWYAANRAVIGEDPDLILPGQRLSVPGR